MPFQIPQRVTDFFAAYPNAITVYANEDEVDYLNNFVEKALKDAKQAKKRLYRISKVGANVTAVLAWPETLQSQLTFDASVVGIVTVIMDGAEVEVGDPTDVTEVEAAFDQAINDIGLEGGIYIEENGNDWVMETKLNGDPEIKVVDENDTTHYFTLKPLV